jgi:hypothetical protein
MKMKLSKFIEKLGIGAVKAWSLLDGKKLHGVAFLVIFRAFLVYSMDHNLLTLIDTLIAAGGISAARDTVRKFEPAK